MKAQWDAICLLGSDNEPVRLAVQGLNADGYVEAIQKAQREVTYLGVTFTRPHQWIAARAEGGRNLRQALRYVLRCVRDAKRALTNEDTLATDEAILEAEHVLHRLTAVEASERVEASRG